MKNTFDIFDLLKSLEERNDEINSVFQNESSFLDKEISMVWSLIEKEMGIKDTDKSSDILCEFGCGNITKKQAIKMLKKLV